MTAIKFLRKKMENPERMPLPIQEKWADIMQGYADQEVDRAVTEALKHLH